ncbi:MAG: GlxA family transcriptional regulator [Xanthobacteraceae bacterium]|nr:GlxA family transcriptional regulator [Xanthobacteraceae bacterium]MBV9632966.1 GlxA family transcriptional regulator [Xanthobacteraceae bacterium]
MSRWHSRQRGRALPTRVGWLGNSEPRFSFCYLAWPSEFRSVLPHHHRSSPSGPSGSRLIVFAVYDGMRLLDLTGPLDALSFPNEMHQTGGPAPYVLRVVSERGGLVSSSCGLAVATEPLSAVDDSTIDTLIVAGGAAAFRPTSNQAAVDAWIQSHAALVGWISRRAAQVRRICSVCTGAFLLAAAVQLKGRSIATHWSSIQLLSTCFPDVIVKPDRLFVNDGPIWTSGGVTAGIDLALALVEDDLGSEFALQVARVMVVFANRPGGQSQFTVPLAAPLHRGHFAELHAWLRKNLAKDLRVEDLAARVSMSRRTFMRAYVAATGRTPGKTIEAMRLDAARMALEATNKPVKQVARETGFGDEERMRRVFQRQLGVSPADYRARFSLRARVRTSTRTKKFEARVS